MLLFACDLDFQLKALKATLSAFFPAQGAIIMHKCTFCLLTDLQKDLYIFESVATNTKLNLCWTKRECDKTC